MGFIDNCEDKTFPIVQETLGHFWHLQNLRPYERGKSQPELCHSRGIKIPMNRTGALEIKTWSTLSLVTAEH